MKVLSQLAHWFDDQGRFADADVERLAAIGLLSRRSRQCACGYDFDDCRCDDDRHRPDPDEVRPEEAGATDPTDAAIGTVAHVRPKQLGRRDGPQRSIRRAWRELRERLRRAR